MTAVDFLIFSCINSNSPRRARQYLVQLLTNGVQVWDYILVLVLETAPQFGLVDLREVSGVRTLQNILLFG